MKEDSPRMFRPVCLGDDTPFELQLLVKGSARSPRRKKQIDTRKKISAPGLYLQCMYFARRQAFREAIVKAVMASGGEERISSADVPFDDERTISRYYFYVAHGMDLNLTEPMDSSWLDSILAKIQLPHCGPFQMPHPVYVRGCTLTHTATPERLRRQEGARRLLAREVREQYLQAVRKAVVDFALQDPFDADVRDVVAAARERDSAARRELRETSATWRDGYEAARYAIARDLHILNPCHVAASRLWHTRPYQNLRLLNVAELPEKMELMEFRTLVLRNIEKTRDFLKNEWLSAIQSLLVKCDRRNQMPKPRERRRNRSFYNSLAVVMGNQLQSLCIRSIEDYTSLICDPEVRTSASECRC
ncbi:hypothetical protein PR048_023175 [Dryococelus australis]|uniref:Uncharacterized protein n=1 Tax=Dryococelus australis TaxID=614101 RepID=A0ABQ9GTE4_9NEOP|nr:hypothetical protein PR048_023175 [Dryococelus australis]